MTTPLEFQKNTPLARNSVLGRTAGRQGFALIIALSLTSFVLLLIMGMSAFVRLETESSSKFVAVEQARANALVGLQIALGDSQRFLGPDQRITANASTQPDSEHATRHWLGVWATDGSGHMTWLVSGSGPEEEGSLSTVSVVGTGTATELIEAPLIPLPESSKEAGGYAFWVTDLSQKARMDLTDPRLSASAFESSRRSTLTAPPMFGVSGMTGLDVLDILYEASPGGEEARRALGKMTRPGELELLGVAYDQPSKLHFHNLAGYSYGLQVNVVDGGMKVDLSSGLRASASFPTGEIFTNGPNWNLLRSYTALQPDASAEAVGSTPRNPTTTQGTLAGTYPQTHGLSPLVLHWEVGTEMVLQSAPPEGYQSGDTVPVLLQIEPVLVMVNPYDVALESSRYIFRITSGGGSYDMGTGNYQRQPSFRVNKVRGGKTQITPNQGRYLNEWLPNFTGHGASSSTSYAQNSLRFGVETAFEPGEVKVFTLSADTPLPGVSEDYVLELEEGEPLGYVAVSRDVSSTLDETFTASDYDDYVAGVMSFELAIRTGQVVGSLYHDEVDMEHSPSSKTLTSTHRTRLLTVAGERVYFGSNLKGPPDLLNSERNPESLEGAKTLANYNVRSQYQSAIFPSANVGGDFNAAPTYTARTDDQSFYGGLGNVWDPAIIDPATGTARLVLFHIPREEILSLGELQHADLSRNVYTPSYAIGNSLASPWVEAGATIGPRDGLEDLSYLLNEALWDDYFFSGIPEAGAGEVSNNTRIQVLASGEVAPSDSDLRDPEQAAGYLVTDGPFNVNSDSVEAWAALLASARGRPINYTNLSTGASSSEGSQGGAFGRLPVPAGGSVPLLTGQDDRPDVTESEYWRGFRNLTDDQIRNLAGQIVHQVRERGPFLSLAGFVNRDIDSTELAYQLAGALQAAIDSEEEVTIDGITYAPSRINPEPTVANSIDTPSSEIGYIFPDAVKGVRSSMAPGFLTQADVLSQIGSFLTVRGDTFLVRAYGETRNPVTGELSAVARCEAIIQRIPAYLEDPSQDVVQVANGNNQAMGRGFRIVTLRWLNESEF